MSMTNSSQPPTQKNLSLSDLESSENNSKSQTMSIYEFRSSQLEFAANVASTNRDIEAARDDLQVLMTKAHAYCKNTGVASGSPLLASTPQDAEVAINMVLVLKSNQEQRILVPLRKILFDVLKN